MLRALVANQRKQPRGIVRFRLGNKPIGDGVDRNEHHDPRPAPARCAARLLRPPIPADPAATSTTPPPPRSEARTMIIFRASAPRDSMMPMIGISSIVTNRSRRKNQSRLGCRISHERLQHLRKQHGRRIQRRVNAKTDDAAQHEIPLAEQADVYDRRLDAAVPRSPRSPARRRR